MPLTAPSPGIDPDQTYYVKNNHKGPATFNFGDAMRGQQYRWEGQGHDSGEDILGLPGHVIRDPQFQSALRKGLFSLVEEGEAFNGHDAVFGETEFEAKAVSQMERPKEKELVPRECIVPLKGGKVCGTQLFTRQSDLSTTPPLCQPHEKFASAFEWDGTEWVRTKS
jgi:hypothetical protein